MRGVHICVCRQSIQTHITNKSYKIPPMEPALFKKALLLILPQRNSSTGGAGLGGDPERRRKEGECDKVGRRHRTCQHPAQHSDNDLAVTGHQELTRSPS